MCTRDPYIFLLLLLFFTDLYMWASFVTLNVFQLVVCFGGDGMFDLMHFAPMHESLANLRRWTDPGLVFFYNHFITRITLHVFLHLISLLSGTNVFVALYLSVLAATSRWRQRRRHVSSAKLWNVKWCCGSSTLRVSLHRILLCVDWLN